MDLGSLGGTFVVTADQTFWFLINIFRQNGQTFRERTGAFRKIIKKHAELGNIHNQHIYTCTIHSWV